MLVCIQAVQKNYRSKPELEPLPVTFAAANVGEEIKLGLDVEEKGVTTDGWRIIPAVFPPEVNEILCEYTNKWASMNEPLTSCNRAVVVSICLPYCACNLTYETLQFWTPC